MLLISPTWPLRYVFAAASFSRSLRCMRSCARRSVSSPYDDLSRCISVLCSSDASSGSESLAMCACPSAPPATYNPFEVGEVSNAVRPKAPLTRGPIVRRGMRSVAGGRLIAPWGRLALLGPACCDAFRVETTKSVYARRSARIGQRVSTMRIVCVARPVQVRRPTVGTLTSLFSATCT